MPDDDGGGTHGAARAAAEPRRPAPRDVNAAHLRADPRDARRVPGRQGRQRQAHVRARQGPAAGVRHPAAARRHRRLGHGAGLHHPQGRVLPAGDRVHARGARRPARGRPERRGEHPCGAGGTQAVVRRRRRRAGRPRRRAARIGFRCPQRAGDRLRRRRPAPAEGAVRVPHLARARRGSGRSTRTRWSSGAATGTWWATTAIATTCGLSVCPGSRATSRMSATAASRPRGSGRPITCRPAPGRPRRRTMPRSPSRPGWHGGPKGRSPAPTEWARTTTDGSWSTCRWPTPDCSRPSCCSSVPRPSCAAPEELRDEIVRRLEAVGA